MIQSSSELILGFELNETHAQLTYFHPSVREPVTMSCTAGTEDYLLPPSLRRDASGAWHFWHGEPQEEGKERDLCRIAGIFRKIQNMEEISDGGVVFEPDEILGIYVGVCLEMLKVLTENAKIQVMVTVKELTDVWCGAIVAAMQKNGIDRKHIYLQDYSASFYYYTVNQKKELWYKDVALITYEDERICGSVLHIDRRTRPAIARVELVSVLKAGEAERGDRNEHDWNKERDRLFFEFLKKLFERREVAVAYLVGDFFSKSWADRSIQYLCNKRHVFQGTNLYSKGACYAALERAGMIGDRGILFGGRDMVRDNLRMEMRMHGKRQMYSLITAGINWYEAYHVCEFLLDHENEIRITSLPMEKGEAVVHILRLPGLPKRPDRATRIRMTVYFSAPGCCCIEAEDLGLGELFRSSGLTWKREIRF